MRKAWLQIQVRAIELVVQVSYLVVVRKDYGGRKAPPGS